MWHMQGNGFEHVCSPADAFVVSISGPAVNIRTCVALGSASPLSPKCRRCDALVPPRWLRRSPSTAGLGHAGSGPAPFGRVFSVASRIASLLLHK